MVGLDGERIAVMRFNVILSKLTKQLNVYACNMLTHLSLT